MVQGSAGEGRIIARTGRRSDAAGSGFGGRRASRLASRRPSYRSRCGSARWIHLSSGPCDPVVDVAASASEPRRCRRGDPGDPERREQQRRARRNHPCRPRGLGDGRGWFPFVLRSVPPRLPSSALPALRFPSSSLFVTAVSLAHALSPTRRAWRRHPVVAGYARGSQRPAESLSKGYLRGERRPRTLLAFASGPAVEVDPASAFPALHPTQERPRLVTRSLPRDRRRSRPLEYKFRRSRESATRSFIPLHLICDDRWKRSLSLNAASSSASGIVHGDRRR